MSLENYLEKLQKNIDDLESADISLAKGIEIFQNGVENTKKCLEILNESKGKIMVIKAEMDEILDFSADKLAK